MEKLTYDQKMDEIGKQWLLMYSQENPEYFDKYSNGEEVLLEDSKCFLMTHIQISHTYTDLMNGTIRTKKFLIKK